MATYYELLEISPSASVETIRAAYKAQAEASVKKLTLYRNFGYKF